MHILINILIKILINILIVLNNVQLYTLINMYVFYCITLEN